MNAEQERLELLANVELVKFILELMFGNHFAVPGGQEALKEFRATVIDRILFRSTLPPGNDDDYALIVQQRVAKLAERFFERVEARREEIEKTPGV